MKNLLLPITLVAGLVCSPVVLAETTPVKTQQDSMVTMVLKTADGHTIRVLVHKDDVTKVKKLKKGDNIKLNSYGFGTGGNTSSGGGFFGGGLE